MGTGSIFSTSHHYLFRDLNYHTGRWLTCDPIGEQGGWNLYAFCGNDGVSKWDRLGTRCCTAKEIIECMKALGRVWKKLLFVEDDIRRYSPTKDYYGGFLTHGGKITSPCGHYKEINERYKGIKNDLVKYKKCFACDNFDNRSKYPRYVDEWVSRPIKEPEPIINNSKYYSVEIITTATIITVSGYLVLKLGRALIISIIATPIAGGGLW